MKETKKMSKNVGNSENNAIENSQMYKLLKISNTMKSYIKQILKNAILYGNQDAFEIRERIFSGFEGAYDITLV